MNSQEYWDNLIGRWWRKSWFRFCLKILWSDRWEVEGQVWGGKFYQLKLPRGSIDGSNLPVMEVLIVQNCLYIVRWNFWKYLKRELVKAFDYPHPSFWQNIFIESAKKHPPQPWKISKESSIFKMVSAITFLRRKYILASKVSNIFSPHKFPLQLRYFAYLRHISHTTTPWYKSWWLMMMFLFFSFTLSNVDMRRIHVSSLLFKNLHFSTERKIIQIFPKLIWDAFMYHHCS